MLLTMDIKYGHSTGNGGKEPRRLLVSGSVPGPVVVVADLLWLSMRFCEGICGGR